MAKLLLIAALCAAAVSSSVSAAFVAKDAAPPARKASSVTAFEEGEWKDLFQAERRCETIHGVGCVAHNKCVIGCHTSASTIDVREDKFDGIRHDATFPHVVTAVSIGAHKRFDLNETAYAGAVGSHGSIKQPSHHSLSEWEPSVIPDANTLPHNINRGHAFRDRDHAPPLLVTYAGRDVWINDYDHSVNNSGAVFRTIRPEHGDENTRYSAGHIHDRKIFMIVDSAEPKSRILYTVDGGKRFNVLTDAPHERIHFTAIDCHHEGHHDTDPLKGCFATAHARNEAGKEESTIHFFPYPLRKHDEFPVPLFRCVELSASDKCRLHKIQVEEKFVIAVGVGAGREDPETKVRQEDPFVVASHDGGAFWHTLHELHREFRGFGLVTDVHANVRHDERTREHTVESIFLVTEGHKEKSDSERREKNTVLMWTPKRA